MNILFLTILEVNNIDERGLYNDLMRTFRDHGHQVYVACPTERRNKKQTNLQSASGIEVLSIKTLNFQKTNIIEKGVSTILFEQQYYKAIKKYFGNIKFDLVLYSTPPITFTKVIKYIKKRDQAQSYLLLKDIFPQNAVDLGMLKPNGFLHKYFKKKEAQLYATSDFIGCMSPANVNYLLAKHTNIDANKVEVNPNSIIPINYSLDDNLKRNIRLKYKIPVDCTVFIYGGNLGKPQGVDFLIEILAANLATPNMFFLIVGSGTEFEKLQKWFEHHKPTNSCLLKGLPKDEYDNLLLASDVGLIFLDPRFTIPNFPSRLLSYLEAKMPVLAATDVNTDIGTIAENNDFGFWCESGDLNTFNQQINKLVNNPLLIEKMGKNSYDFLKENYTSEKSYQLIINRLNNV